MAKDRKPKRARVQVPTGGWQAAKGVPSTPDVSTEKRAFLLDIDHPDVTARRLVWRFGEIDSGGSWPPAAIGFDAMGDLLKKMADYESMTLGEIFRPGSEHGKRYVVENLPARALKRLREIERDDETEIARLRCGGRPRLYGFLREHVFHVVWWDAEHEVYPSKKRNT
ncbi:MAG: hypothetical protein IR160_11405 [Salinibacterium sp.]|nr:hypothetical protein [Salinibacterium sp.]MBF0673178.1 hypothetical protein [Salinibacterium sp.]